MNDWIGIVALAVITLVTYVLGEYWYFYYPISIFASAVLALAVIMKLILILAPLFSEAVKAMKRDERNMH